MLINVQLFGPYGLKLTRHFQAFDSNHYSLLTAKVLRLENHFSKKISFFQYSILIL